MRKTGPPSKPDSPYAAFEIGDLACQQMLHGSTTRLNLPENASSVHQREVLDALPVLVFLERAGQIIFANAEARRAMGLSDAEWVQRPIEDVVWGLFPGKAEPQTMLTGGKAGSQFQATLACKGGQMAPLE